MKTGKLILRTTLIVFLASIFYGFYNELNWNVKSEDIEPSPGFPEEIMKIIIHSCYDCHTTDSQYKAAIDAMDFLKWNEYKPAKKIQLLDKMDKVINDKRMPPEKYLNQNPEKILTGEQVETISKWAKEETDKLLQ